MVRSRPEVEVALPAISVLIPVRNGLPFLREALESVLSQTYRDFEVVCVEDASSDGSATMLASYQERDERVRVVPGPGRGIAAALNRGLEACRAPLIARMDADDVCESGRLEAQAAALHAHPGWGALGSATTLIDEAGLVLGSQAFPLKPEDVREALERVSALAHPSVLIRKALLEEVGAYRAVFEGAEDYDLWLRLSERAELANLEEPFLRYRIHRGQVSASRASKQALAALGARVAARDRRRGSPAPFDGPTSREALEGAGIPRLEIEQTVFDQLVGQAVALLSVGDPDGSGVLIAEAEQLAKKGGLDAERLARARWIRTKALWKRGQGGGSLVSLLSLIAGHRKGLIEMYRHRGLKRDDVPVVS